MDTLNCPPGFASDRVMIYDEDFVSGSCEVPIALYVCLFTAMTVVRALVVALQFFVWVRREGRVALRTGKDRKRIPVLPMLSLLSLTALILFTILTSLNIANGSNGGSLFLLLIYYLPASLGALVLVFRVVKVGKKIIPLAKLRLDGSENEKRLSRLSETTIPLKAFYVVDTLAVLITPISAIIGLSIPVYATFQAVVAGFAAQDLLVGWGLAYQYQRVISAIRTCQNSTQLGGSRASDLDKAILQLRQQQLAVGLICPVGALLWIVTIVRWTLPYYWIVFLQFLAEVLAMVMITISHARTSCFPRRRSPKGTDATDDSSAPVRPGQTQIIVASGPSQLTSNPQYGSVHLPSNAVDV